MEHNNKQKNTEQAKKNLENLFYAVMGFIFGMMVMAILVGRQTNNIRSAQIINGNDTMNIKIK